MAILSACSLMALMILISPGFGQSVTRTIPTKLFRHEDVCDDIYGTILGYHFKLQHPLQCGAKCAEDPACNSAIYNYLGNHCTKNSDLFENRTNVGCTQLVAYIYVTTELEPRVMPDGGCFIPQNTANVEYPTMPTSMSPAGTQIPYICHPCTYFPPVGSSSMVTCQQNGMWSDAVCLFGPDVGHIFDGTAIPQNAVGCNANATNNCSFGEGNFTFDGILSLCFCDQNCCGAWDCCFDSICHDDYMAFYFNF